MTALGFDKPPYVLPFDHRGSFQRKLFGWTGTLTANQTAQIAAAKEVIYDAFQAAVRRRVPERKVGRRAVRHRCPSRRPGRSGSQCPRCRRRSNRGVSGQAAHDSEVSHDQRFATSAMGCYR
jgi:hypothetical protein